MKLDFRYWKKEKKKTRSHLREVRKTKTKGADLRLINCRHEGVQGDDDESVWKNRTKKTNWTQSVSDDVKCWKQQNHVSQYNLGYSKHLLRLHFKSFNYCQNIQHI